MYLAMIKSIKYISNANYISTAVPGTVAKEMCIIHGLSISTKLIVISLVGATRSKSPNELKNTEYK